MIPKSHTFQVMNYWQSILKKIIGSKTDIHRPQKVYEH